MNARSTMIRLAAVSAALGALFFLARPDAAEKPKPAAEPNYFSFVRSMEGTRPDGDVKVGDGDELVVDAELGHLFDYYLAGQGERTLAEIRAETEREIERRLKPKAATAAKRLLAQYWSYKEALAVLEKAPAGAAGSAAALRQRMAARDQLRTQYFSAAEARGLFGFDDAYDADAVSRLEVSQDKSLSVQEKRDRLAALDAAQSPALREEREAPRRILQLEESVQAMRAKGSSDDDIYRMRAAAISPEAAARLADVDRDEAAWKSRITAYQLQRKAILADSRVQPSEQQLALEQLRNAQFTGDEQRRLGAYE